MHLPDLIVDLGLILMAAAVVSLIFKKLKQPIVLGYLIAGFLVGPHFTFFPSVKDSANISIWAEIGVIFMLFGLGLEFSFKKLSKVGKSASITASFEILSMLGLGYILGQLLGWSTMDSLFLGGVLSVSSTTIIMRAFDELGIKGKSFASLVFGVLIVEDLIAILLLVLLSSMAVTHSPSGTELMVSSLKLGFFLVVWFLLGIYLLPLVFKALKEYLSDETMLIVSIALCLMMVIVATKAGFSPALGAFVMGSFLAETPKGHRIEHLIHPVKDLFSAVFFVSVGMLINPKILIEYSGVILLITLVTIFGKLLSSSLGALVSGRSLKSSVQAGMSLAQIGEFSFIIATLGSTLKVTSEFIYPITVAVSAVTTFTTPYLIKISGGVANRLFDSLPLGLKERLARYEAAMSGSSDKGVLSLIWKEYGIKVCLNAVMVIAITLTMVRWVLPYFSESFSVEINGFISLTAGAMTLVLSAPFLWAIFFGGPSHAITYHEDTLEQLRGLQVGISILRFLIGFLVTGFVVSNFTSMAAFSGILFSGLAVLTAFFFSGYSEFIYTKIEGRFIANLTANERAEIERRKGIPALAPWNAILAEFVVSAHSPLVMKTLRQSGIKENFGITVAMIERSEKRILAPNREDILLPCDKLFLIGTEDQLAAIRELIETKQSNEIQSVDGSFGLASLILEPEDKFINKSIRECGIREAVNGLIVGIERNGQRYLSPDSSMTLLSGDLIWLVGDLELIKDIRTAQLAPAPHSENLSD